MVNALVVDDERLARQGIRLALKDEPDVKIVGEAADGPSALQAIIKLEPDLVFLDIKMPGLDGFEVVDRVNHSQTRQPVFIFVTAFDQYAIKAFEARAIHYLLKPVDPKRVLNAVQRARTELAKDGLFEAAHEEIMKLVGSPDTRVPTRPDAAARTELDHVVIKVQDRFLVLKTGEVDWIESAGNYLNVHARGRSFMLRMTMGQLEERLDSRKFVRIHRSTIVNIDRLVEVKPSLHGDFNVILSDGTALRMSRGYRDGLLPR